MLLKYHSINVRAEYLKGIAAKRFRELDSPLEVVSLRLTRTIALIDTYLYWEAVEAKLPKEEPLLKKEIQMRIEQKQPPVYQGFIQLPVLTTQMCHRINKRDF